MALTTMELLEREEGRVAHVYQDSKGLWTIGVGHLVDKRKGGRLPEHIINALLLWDVQQCEKDLDRALPWWRKLDKVRQDVLISMCFQMGIGDDNHGLLSFKNTLRFIKAGLYDLAASNMLKSKWANEDTPERAKRHAAALRTGEWE
jgi:lysozyme